AGRGGSASGLSAGERPAGRRSHPNYIRLSRSYPMASLFLRPYHSSPLRPAARVSLIAEPLEDRTTPAPLIVNTLADETNPNDGLLSFREAELAANADPAPTFLD